MKDKPGKPKAAGTMTRLPTEPARVIKAYAARNGLTIGDVVQLLARDEKTLAKALDAAGAK